MYIKSVDNLVKGGGQMTPSGAPPLKIKVKKQFVLKVKVRKGFMKKEKKKKKRKERKKEREKEKKIERKIEKQTSYTDTYSTEKGWGSDISVTTKSIS